MMTMSHTDKRKRRLMLSLPQLGYSAHDNVTYRLAQTPPHFVAARWPRPSHEGGRHITFNSVALLSKGSKYIQNQSRISHLLSHTACLHSVALTPLRHIDSQSIASNSCFCLSICADIVQPSPVNQDEGPTHVVVARSQHPVGSPALCGPSSSSFLLAASFVDLGSGGEAGRRLGGGVGSAGGGEASSQAQTASSASSNP